MPVKSMFDLSLEGKELGVADLTGTELLVVERFSTEINAQETCVVTLNTLRDWLGYCTATSLQLSALSETSGDVYVSYELVTGSSSQSDVWFNYYGSVTPTRDIFLDFLDSLLIVDGAAGDFYAFRRPSIENGFALIGLSQSDDWDRLARTTLTLKIYDDGNSNPPDGGLDLVAAIFGESVSAHSCAIIYGDFIP